MNHIETLRRFTIRTRMLVSIAVMVGMLGTLGGIGLAGMKRIHAINVEHADMAARQQIAIGALVQAFFNLRRFEKDLVIGYSNPERANDYLAKWRKNLASAQVEVEKILARDDHLVNPVLHQFRPHLEAYQRLAEPVFRSLLAGGIDSASAADQLLARAKDEAHAAEALLTPLAQAQAAETQQSLATAEAQVRSATWVFGAVLLLALVLVIPLTLINMQSIRQPIEQARRLAERIATGDLNAQLDNFGQDEPAQLLCALAAMQDALRDIVGQVREASESIQGASAEVASGNADLSGRTEQAASSLQQTSSAMEQLTQSVRQSADASHQASTLATSASDAAQRGGEVVSQVVSTMDDINVASRRIADIIGTIDGIAFQTNILALNAAVEAARAGEQGRGFAVVASEVRSLAQRSAEAAREIKSLIGASVEKVDNGARLVQAAGATMGEIVSSVRRVAAIIGEISGAAREQSQGIGQINSAVGELDRMTQQNSALVEQSAAAAESLKDQAARLGTVVARFRTTEA